jgi:hypothetical protein
MRTKTRLLRSGLQIALGAELVSVSKRMKQYQNETQLAKATPIEVPVAPPVNKEYQYVMREKAIKQINTVLNELINATIMNDIYIEPNILNQAKELMDLFAWIIESSPEEKEAYGTQA